MRRNRNKILIWCAVLTAAGVMCFLGWKRQDNGLHASAKEEVAAVPVVLTTTVERTFEKALCVQGNVQAKDAALVSARIDGVITEIFVDEGDEVVAGETKLFQIDRIKVEEAVAISKQDLALARCGKREAAANLASLQAQFDKAEIDFHRFQRLLEKEAVTQDALEQQETRYKATKAGLDHAKTLVDLAAEQEKKALSALAIAKKNLEDSLVLAPISGQITHQMKEVGEFGAAGRPVFRIAQTGIVEVSAFLPAEAYAEIREGITPVRLTVGNIEAGQHPITYKSPAIEPKLRTFEIKCLLENPPENVVPGAIGQADAILDQRQGLGIPTAAIQQRAGKDVVFTVENGHARVVPVVTGLEDHGWVELKESGLSAGDKVVSQGQFLIEDGTPITVQNKAN